MKTGMLPDSFHAIFRLIGALHNETCAVIDRAYSVNECQAGDSPPDTGGVAAPSGKRCEATAAAQTGWSGLTKRFGMHFLKKVPFPTTPSAPSKDASRLLLDVAATPPMSGGDWRATPFIHTIYERAHFADFRKNARS